MWSNLAACWAILLGIGFMMLANGLQGTLLGVRASIEGFSVFTTGIMMSGYFIGLFIGSMLAPFLVSRVGHIRVFSALASLASISILFHGVYIDPWIWMVMRVITGISFAGFYVVTESWLNDRASNETRGKVLSVYMVIVTGSMGAGQFLLNLARPDAIDLFILISVIISFGLIPILLTVRPAPSFEASSKMSVIDLYRASPLAVIGNCLTGMAHGTIFGLGAIYAAQVLVDIKAISWFMASFLIGSLVLQWPVGYISDRIGRRGVMAGLSIFAIACCLMAMPMYSICVAYANDRLEPHQIVGASGSLVMVSGFGAMTGPIVIAFFMDYIDVAFYFWGIAIVFMTILLFTLVRIGARPGIALEEQSSLVAGPFGTPIAEYLSPDSVEYAEAAACDELDKLDEQEDVTERKL
jgi:MFS family permease